MKYEDTGFRAVYRQFLVIPVNDKIREAVAEYPQAKSAECILGFGFCSREEGLQVLVLAAGLKDEKGFHFYDVAPKDCAVVGLEDIKEESFDVLDPAKGDLAGQFRDHLAALDRYAVSEEIEKTRQMGFLDGLRDGSRIDDVTVCLVREGLDPEDCLVRITGVGERWITGEMLDEPAQDFGYHRGDTIAFFARQQEDGSIGCFSDMTPDLLVTRAQLEDGSVLRAAVAEFKADRNEENAIEVLQILRDSRVWIPCTVELNEQEQQDWSKIFEDIGMDPDSQVAQTMMNKEPVRLVPDILRNGEALFLPVFSDEASMGEYGEQFTKVQKSVLEAMVMAEDQRPELFGIVLDPFTEPYVLERRMFDAVREIKSRLID